MIPEISPKKTWEGAIGGIFFTVVAFLVYGIMIAIVNAIGPKKGAEKRKNFSCEGCPSAALCGKVACAENAELVSAAENNEKEDTDNA